MTGVRAESRAAQIRSATGFCRPSVPSGNFPHLASHASLGARGGVGVVIEPSGGRHVIRRLARHQHKATQSHRRFPPPMICHSLTVIPSPAFERSALTPSTRRYPERPDSVTSQTTAKFPDNYSIVGAGASREPKITLRLRTSLMETSPRPHNSAARGIGCRRTREGRLPKLAFQPDISDMISACRLISLLFVSFLHRLPETLFTLTPSS